MQRLLLSLVLGSALLLSAAADADDRASPDEAKAMAIRAAAYLQSIGPEKAFAAFDAKDKAWHDRDLYVFVLDRQGVEMAHGNNPGLIGKSVIDLKDVDGRPFIRDMVAITDAGWVSYKWQNPVTRFVDSKTSYQVRVGDYVVGVGAYAQ